MNAPSAEPVQPPPRAMASNTQAKLDTSNAGRENKSYFCKVTNWLWCFPGKPQRSDLPTACRASWRFKTNWDIFLFSSRWVLIKSVCLGMRGIFIPLLFNRKRNRFQVIRLDIESPFLTLGKKGTKRTQSES